MEGAVAEGRGRDEPDICAVCLTGFQLRLFVVATAGRAAMMRQGVQTCNYHSQLC